MASTIKLKNGSGAPTTGDLVQGEPALDLTNKRLYTENASGVVIEVGTNPSALTIGGTALTATATELNVLDGITATTAELNYTDGVTSNIQTQLNTKAPIASPTFTGTTTIPTADINGGAIDGTVIGGSTAAAGTFTTVTASGDVTLSGGTANGVAFANGSKVLTTGSTLTFDGTNTVTLNASAANLTLGISTNYGLVTATGTNPASIYFNGGSRTGFESHLQYFGANHVFFNETGGSEIMRLLNTGNVGIGVSSPAAKLEIGGAGEGIILASPDGTRYEITVANGGTLTVTAV